MMNIIVNLNKPRDISSHAAVSKVKRLFGAKKAGHAGTLDPVATGVLLVCLNEATKITGFLSTLEKEYRVRLKLGERTDTYDGTGKVVETLNVPQLNEADILDILPGFTGEIQQTPPAYSAVKISGKPSYKLARKGLEVILQPKTVYITSLELLGFHSPYIDLHVSCSKGTYIRSICNDIGIALKTGAHMISLERTRVGDFRIDASATLQELEQNKSGIYTIDSALNHMKELILDENLFRKTRNGVPIEVQDSEILLQTDDYIKLKDPTKNIFGIGRFDGRRILIERILN
jgi:tRNA pseudouridine55 synthase